MYGYNPRAVLPTDRTADINAVLNSSEPHSRTLQNQLSDSRRFICNLRLNQSFLWGISTDDQALISLPVRKRLSLLPGTR